MPGRQSTGPRSLLSKPSNPKNTKRKKQRSLNALSIAEKTNPERIKIRKHRLGETERDDEVKRKRDVAQQGDPGDLDDEDGGGGRSKRRKVRSSGGQVDKIDHGSDSEGNKWMLGGVARDDDSSLDSDEAMGASDEERYGGFSFQGSSSTGKRPKKPRTPDGREVPGSIDLSEGEEHTDADDDGSDQAVDLVTELDRRSDEGDMDESGSTVSSVRREEEPVAEHSRDNESALSISDEENDTQDSAKLASLRSLVAAMNEHDDAQAPGRRVPDINESNIPSDYGLNSKQKLTVADLLPSVKDPQLKKSLGVLVSNDTNASSKRSGIPGKLDVPLPKRQQNRLDRAAAYEKSKETLNRWIDTVKHNRRAEHLSFPLQDPDAINAQGADKLDRRAKPLNDLEATIQNILYDSGLAPTNGKSEEEQIQAFEELEANKMPLEEVQARRAELRRARDLLFREEIRAKRIKKIKSKSYRRVHRKERERLVQKDKEAQAAAGVDDSESEKERKDKRRAEERMGAKHRESRWAKGVKESGRMAWDEDARAGVEEMARREENLKRRILGEDVDGSEEETSSEDDEEEEEEDGEEKLSKTLEDRLQRLEDFQGDVKAGVRSSTSALSSMKFMQNAEASRKATNDEAVQQMQRELAGEETASEEEEENGPGRRVYGPTNTVKQSTKFTEVVKRNDFEEGWSSGDEMEGLPEGDEEVQIIVDGGGAAQSGPRTAVGIDLAVDQQGKRGTKLITSLPRAGVEENPWLSGGKPKSKARDGRLQDYRASAIISNELPDPVPSAVAVKSQDRAAVKAGRSEPTGQDQSSSAMKTSTLKDDNSDAEEQEVEERTAAPFVLRNHDLVGKAFAGDDVVAEFEKEKEERMQSEDEQVIDETLAGWGTWVGAGIGKKAERRNKNRFLSKQEGVPRAKRQDAKLDKVIINEKRVKKNSKYLASQLPHPFETRQQYERSLRLPVGPEWTTKETFQAATKPRVLMKQGIITPLAKPII
ncbi:MAG: hypothetical protein Q9210_000841 [Variospora velana]